MGKIYKILPVLLIFLLAFISSPFNSQTSSGWNQQWLPNLNGRSIYDVFFLDSLTGWAVTNAYYIDTSYVLKTTNAGDNWTIQYNNLGFGGGLWGYTKIYFLNKDTGFAGDVSGISKTTDGGLNWTYIIPRWNFVVMDMSILNEDTMWVVGSAGFWDAVWRTTNGGANWQEQLTWGSSQYTNIYMYDSRIGFASLSFPAGMWKTTNSGVSWFNITNENFSYMCFSDSLNGWKTNGILKKTTDGGYNWITQVMPSGGYISSNQVLHITSINKDTLWAVGGYLAFEYPPLRLRGMIYKTTNAGLNWGFQLPDTQLVTCTSYKFIDFINKNVGWVYNGYVGAHTITGGDTVVYYGIQQISNTVPEKFTLKQNYPNPFNPRTVIPYSLSASAYVKIIAYDITGKEVQRMVDNYQHAGAYEVDFMGKFTASGVYFYRMEVDGWVVGTKKMILLK